MWEDHVVVGQCDQMSRLFFIIWLATATQICPKIIKIAKVRLNFCQTQNKLECWPKIFESLPKWRNFSKSGHTSVVGCGRFDVGTVAPSYDRKKLSPAEGLRSDDVIWPVPHSPNVRIIFLKWVNRSLFLFILSFLHYNFNNTNWKKHWVCTWDSNLGPQDGRHRQNQRAMAADPTR